MKRISFSLFGILIGMLFFNQQLHAQKKGSAHGTIWFGDIKPSIIALHKKEGFLSAENRRMPAEFTGQYYSNP